MPSYQAPPRAGQPHLLCVFDEVIGTPSQSGTADFLGAMTNILSLSAACTNEAHDKMASLTRRYKMQPISTVSGSLVSNALRFSEKKKGDYLGPPSLHPPKVLRRIVIGNPPDKFAPA